MRPRRLTGMTGIGVDSIGNLAHALAHPEVLRFENLDTDLQPPDMALKFTKSAVDQDRNNRAFFADAVWTTDEAVKAMERGS